MKKYFALILTFILILTCFAACKPSIKDGTVVTEFGGQGHAAVTEADGGVKRDEAGNLIVLVTDENGRKDTPDWMKKNTHWWLVRVGDDEKYVDEILSALQKIGAKTVAVTCNPNAKMSKSSTNPNDVIFLEDEPEVIMKKFKKLSLLFLNNEKEII